MKPVLPALAFVLSIGVVNAQTWVHSDVNGHWYAVDSSPSAWNVAQAWAVSMGGHLPTIRTGQENDWFDTHLLSPAGVGEAWIGHYQDTCDATYVEADGGWKWTSGEQNSYTNWNSIEPNNAGSTGSPLEEWAQYRRFSREWNDHINNAPNTYATVEVISDDCDGNGIPDIVDIINGATDCNTNQVPDSCEIASGAANDCNGNGVPDSCDIASGFSIDCNLNSIPDTCETDCNQNGVPDDCDIAVGTSKDCNGNMVPDSCEGLTGGVIAEYGVGCSGSGGFVPDLSMTGCPVPSGVITMTLADAKPQAAAVLILGLFDTPIPGPRTCTLYASPVVVVTALPLGGSLGVPGSGGVSVTVTIPANQIPVTVKIQAFVADDANAWGYAASNGLSLGI